MWHASTAGTEQCSLSPARTSHLHILRLTFFMCHGPVILQINCIRNNEGEVVEGNEDEIRGVFYVLAMQRQVNEEAMQLEWKVVEMQVQVLDKMI